MFERIQNDGVVPKTTTVGAQARADLVVSPAPASSELRDKAVAPASNGQRVSAENTLMHPLMAVIGQVHDAVDTVAQNDAERKRLDELYAKLFKAYGGVAKGQAPEGLDGEIDKVLADLDKAAGPQASSESDASPVETGENAAGLALRQQREKTLDKILLAMRKVGSLRTKLGDESDAAHTRLLSINSSLTSLSMARAQLDDSNFSITRASSVVDSVMLDLRSAVFAHGKISPDVIRLVMN